MIRRQLQISKNLHESFRTRAMRLFWAIVFACKGIAIGLRGMSRPRLGSAVVFEGRRWVISNWANGPLVTLCGPEYRKGVPYEQIRPIWSPREMTHRFRVMRSWYMTSWHDIDVQRKIYRG